MFCLVYYFVHVYTPSYKLVLVVLNTSALIRILTSNCLLANGQHQVFEKESECFCQLQDWNQCTEIWFLNMCAYMHVYIYIYIHSVSWNYLVRTLNK